MIVHRHLQGQLARAELSWEAPPPLAAWQRLLGLLSDSYRDQEKEQFRLERSLDIHVREIQAVYADLAWERDNLNSILSVLEHGLAILDPEGRLLALNARGEQLLGASEKDLLGTVLAERLGELPPGRSRTSQYELLVEPVWRDGQIASHFVVFAPPTTVAPPPLHSGPEFAVRETLDRVRPDECLALIYREVPLHLRGQSERLVALLQALLEGLEGSPELTLEVRLLERQSERLVLRLDVHAQGEHPAEGDWLKLGHAAGGESLDGRTARWGSLVLEPLLESPAWGLPLAGIRLGLVGEPSLERTVLEEELSRMGAWVRSGHSPPPSLLPLDLVLWHAQDAPAEGLAVAHGPWGAVELRALVDRVLARLLPPPTEELAPLATLEEKPPVKPSKKAKAPAPAPPPPLRVLIAEEFVTSQGYACLVAEDGDEAWALYQEQGADIVITDLLMPGMTGVELCRKVRASDRPQPFFLVLSAAGEQELVESAIDAGADDFLAKPLDYDQLGERLKALPVVESFNRT